MKSLASFRAGLRSTGIISAGLEVIYAFHGFEDIGAGVEGDQQAVDGPLGGFSQQGFELGVGLLDRFVMMTLDCWFLLRLRTG